MIVSRPGIVTDHIQDFDVVDRFLKLPIERFLGIEKIEPIEPQIAMINLLNDPRYRFIVACLSRRTGKTYMANTLGFLKVMEPNTQVLIIAPNFSLSNISWGLQVQKLESHGIEIKSKNKTEREIHLHNGSMLKFGSLSQADSCLGRSYDLIIADEMAIDPKGGEAFMVQLMPTLDKLNSKAIMISTPRGDNFYKEFYNKGFSDDFPSWASIHSTYKDNPRSDAQAIKEAKLSMSRAEFAQEMEASFTIFEGQIYEDFDPELCVKDLSEMDFSNGYIYSTLMGIDPGYKDELASCIVQHDEDEDIYYVVWEYQDKGKNTAVHAGVLYPAYESHDVDQVFVDPSGAQFRQDLSSMFDLPSNKANNSVLDGITFLQRIIQQNKLIVDERCKHIILALRNYRWDPNPNLVKEKPYHDAYSHMADALRYAIYSARRQ